MHGLCKLLPYVDHHLVNVTRLLGTLIVPGSSGRPDVGRPSRYVNLAITCAERARIWAAAIGKLLPAATLRTYEVPDKYSEYAQQITYLKLELAEMRKRCEQEINRVSTPPLPVEALLYTTPLVLSLDEAIGWLNLELEFLTCHAPVLCPSDSSST